MTTDIALLALASGCASFILIIVMICEAFSDNDQ